MVAIPPSHRVAIMIAVTVPVPVLIPIVIVVIGVFIVTVAASLSGESNVAAQRKRYSSAKTKPSV
jgi:hypothetical protein